MEYKHPKLQYCQDELRALLEKLIEGNYHKTAEAIFDQVAHSGVETDFDPELKERPTLEEFLKKQ